jgi:CBS-domain-containing membrane protein
MMKHDISGLPVTDDPRDLVGIVSKADVTRAAAYERITKAHTILRNPWSMLRPMLSRSSREDAKQKSANAA